MPRGPYVSRQYWLSTIWARLWNAYAAVPLNFAGLVVLSIPVLSGTL